MPRKCAVKKMPIVSFAHQPHTQMLTRSEKKSNRRDGVNHAIKVVKDLIWAKINDKENFLNSGIIEQREDDGSVKPKAAQYVRDVIEAERDTYKEIFDCINEKFIIETEELNDPF